MRQMSASLALLALLGAAAASSAGLPVYIVQLEGDCVTEYDGDVVGLEATMLGEQENGKKLQAKAPHVRKYVAHLEAQHRRVLQAAGLEDRLVYSYKYTRNAVAVRLTEDEADALEKHPEVESVRRTGAAELSSSSLDTAKTPREYLGVAGMGSGEGVVIAVIDTGIVPEHPSFSGENYTVPPPGVQWVNATCDFGAGAGSEMCGGKLLKAQAFYEGFLSDEGANASVSSRDEASARDADGHGSHVAGIAAGNVRGTAPRAHLAIYKACWYSDAATRIRCVEADVLAAVEQAVEDEVDVINLSAGCCDFSVNKAWLGADLAGIHTSLAAGNRGPAPGTVWAGSPWMATIASVSDSNHHLRILEALGSDHLFFESESPVRLPDVLEAEVVPADDIFACAPLSNAGEVSGKVALVLRGNCTFAKKFRHAADAGAVAVLVYNREGTEGPEGMKALEEAAIPGAMVAHAVGAALLRAPRPVTVTFTPRSVSRDRRVASESSRGPNPYAVDILKPDFAAPGVGVVGPSGTDSFVAMSGTSMAAPVVAGVMAVLKESRPEWNPWMLRSALSTTAKAAGFKAAFGDAAATPFDIGAGLVDPASALNPGLVYGYYADRRFTKFWYYSFTCKNGDRISGRGTCRALRRVGRGRTFSEEAVMLNLPTVTYSSLAYGSPKIVIRSVTNMNDVKSRFAVKIQHPEGGYLRVRPCSLTLEPGESAFFRVTLIRTRLAVEDTWAFGDFTWVRRPLPGVNASSFIPQSVRSVVSLKYSS